MPRSIRRSHPRPCPEMESFWWNATKLRAEELRRQFAARLGLGKRYHPMPPRRVTERPPGVMYIAARYRT